MIKVSRKAILKIKKLEHKRVLEKFLISVQKNVQGF